MNQSTKSIEDSNDLESTNMEEDPKDYCPGGYHPIKISDVLNDRYQVIRKLGWGGFSTVWKCHDLHSSDNVVAVKVMRSSVSRQAKSEIKCHEIVSDSEQFVKLLDEFKISGVNGIHTCLAFELLNGSLLDLLPEVNKGGIPIPNVKIIAKQLLKALDYLHNECELIHGDIKMENILICTDNRLKVKIGDFGYARRTFRHSDAPIQTVEYRSPEVILVSGYGPSADIWSLACVLFELATGDYLFYPSAGDGYSIAEHHLALMTQLLGEIPQYLSLKGKKGRDFFDENGTLKKMAHLKPFNLHRRLRSNLDRKSVNELSEFLLLMLNYDPDLRLTANECLRHKWLN